MLNIGNEEKSTDERRIKLISVVAAKLKNKNRKRNEKDDLPSLAVNVAIAIRMCAGTCVRV